MDVSSSTTERTVPSGTHAAGDEATDLLTEPVLRIGVPECFDERVDFTAHHPGELVHREPDAMIGHSVLREIVGANLRRAVAGADLRFPHPRPLRLLLRNRCVEQACPQHFHSLELVLKLGLLVLLADDDPARYVRDSNGRVRGVHALSARPRGSEDVDSEVLVLDLDVYLLRLGENSDGGGRGVYASLVLGHGD